MIRIYADTSALFAALVHNDQMHVPARDTMAHLLDTQAEIHLTSYVLLETLALLQARVGLEAARQFEHVFRPLVHVRWVDDELHNRAFRRLEIRSRCQVSLVDCSSFVAMEEAGLQRVFAYDEHFADEGFVVVASPADLPTRVGPSR